MKLKLLTPVNSCEGRYEGSLDVRFTKVCDNACSFCIEVPGIPDQGTSVEAMIESTLASPQETVLVLGGEPLLMLDRVIEYVEAIRPHKKEIFVTTSIPHIITKKTDRFLYLVSMIDGLNVSLQHYDWNKNNEILVARNKYNRIALLEELLKTPDVANKARVSINLVKGGIDNEKDLNAFLDALHAMGVQHVKINEMQSSPENYVSFEKIMGQKMDAPFAYGCQNDIPLREGMRITLKRSCFLVEDSLMASPADVIKLASKIVVPQIQKLTGRTPKVLHGVMYENGRLENGWLVADGEGEKPAPPM